MEVKPGKLYTNGKRVVMLVVDVVEDGALHWGSLVKTNVIALRVQPFDKEDFQFRNHSVYGRYRPRGSIALESIAISTFCNRYPYEVDGVSV